MTAGMVLGSAYCFTISALRGPFDGVVTRKCALGQPRNCLDQSLDKEGSLSELPRRNGEVMIGRECTSMLSAGRWIRQRVQHKVKARPCKYIPASSLPAHYVEIKQDTVHITMGG